MSVQDKVAKSVSEAIALAGYVLSFNLTENDKEYNLEIKYAHHKSITLSFDKKDNLKYVAAKIYDVVDYYTIKFNYPLTLVEYKQNGQKVKFWSFSPEQDEFLTRYIYCINYGLQRDEAKKLSDDDLIFIMGKVFNRRMKIEQ